MLSEGGEVMFYEKGLNHLKSLIGQSVGNAQCYAVVAIYSGVLNGPDLGAGTYYTNLEPIEGEDIYSASEIGSAFKWREFGWEVIKNPTYDQLESGSILCYERNITLSEVFTTDGYYGHCGVICGLNNGKINLYEQNGEKGKIVDVYERDYLNSQSYASVIIPADFDGEPTEFVHGQAIIEEEE
ncbi:CHAP domain-containing protein [Enterococcus dispar]|uniref:CHAP domain-containing protein n=1 Tax=Enterococcus dispar TaxID=44009 RepID=UPI00232DE59D|nr:CHAP domain-containing protein [Enterococcus dispar]WCG33968.1 CHAP domain-containing protein [Enterococcus dispar]